MHQRNIKGLTRDETPRATPTAGDELQFSSGGGRQEEGRVSSNNDVGSDLGDLRSTQAVRDGFYPLHLLKSHNFLAVLSVSATVP